MTLGIVLAAGAALAAGPCEEERAVTGLAVGVRDDAIVVTEVASGSRAATAGLRPGDVVLQVNGTVPRSCAEWGRTVREAKESGKALLVLVGRGTDEVPLGLARQTWAPVPVPGRPAEPVVEAKPAPRPAVRAPAPEPLPADVPVSLDSVLADLGALVGKTRSGLEPYREAVVASRRAVETLAVRKAAPPETVTALRRVARLHETAVLAWEGTDQIRERDGIARRLPISEAATAPYFSGSPVQSSLDEFEFLAETIASEPTPGRFTESSGAWRPALARRLVWERAGEELGRVAAGLAGAP